MEAMEAADSPPSNWKQRLTHPTSLKAIAGGLVLGAAAAAVWWRVSVVPDQARVQMRYESTIDVAKMYGLQLSYKRAKGTYANDLASLLSVDPDASALKASLAANVDMNTLAVDGDANKFRLEVNVLDGLRTPIRVKGPIAPRPSAASSPALPAPPPPMNADGSPLAPAGR